MKSRVFVFALLLLSAYAGGAQFPALPDGKAVKPRRQQETAVRSMPRIEGSSIVCGNKVMTFGTDGKIKISADGVFLGELYCYYSVVRKKDGKCWWGCFDRSAGSLKRKGDVFEWELRRQVENHTWKGAEQKVSITPEGLIKGAGGRPSV